MEARKIVLPGEVVCERKGRKLGRGVYEVEEKILTKFLGVLKESEDEVDVIPLAGVYLPKIGDKVIGIIKGVEVSGWSVDINSPYTAFLPIGEGVEEYVDVGRVDLSRFYDVGDVIFCRVSNVTKSKMVQVSMKYLYTKKLLGGTIVKIFPSKVPRLIGKGGSMIDIIKKKTGTQIIPGENGLVWIKGENVSKVIEVISLIERESHIIGLTEKIGKMLGE
ncbi:MAG: exosome complex RNA-binding protein Rrp4 [Candidatus Aenigmarchaeota archaeon]|nr:exosome complex RNA-binding protein Rrp4 [Candidatus Aenigmarchaeota archaeon]